MEEIEGVAMGIRERLVMWNIPDILRKDFGLEDPDSDGTKPAQSLHRVYE